MTWKYQAIGGLLLGLFCAVAAMELPREIVLDRHASDPAREGAETLRHYLNKVTGKSFAIVENASGPAFYVGESDFTRKLGLTNAGFLDQEYLIQIASGNVILMGRDESDADNAKAKGHSFNANKYFQKIGTIYAVNDFLEKFARVRWYLPTELGEVIIPDPALSLPDSFERRRRPSVDYRSLFGITNIPKALYTWNYDRPAKPDADLLDNASVQKWMRQLKMGGKMFSANHNQYDYYTRFKDRKDFFANGNPQTGNQLCLTNPAVKAQVVQDARDFFDGKYRGTWNIGNYFSVMPADTNTWCKCADCVVCYDPESSAFQNGSKSRYVWTFVAEVAKELAKSHPGKFISCCAYWDYRDYPEGLTFPDNVAVMLTMSHFEFADSKKREEVWKHIRRWREATPEVYIWDYFLMPVYPAFDRFPPTSARMIAREVKQMKAERITGGLMAQLDEYYWRNPVMDHLRVYVMMKLLDDWELDPEAIMSEYFQLFYGDAGQPMRKYFDELERLFLSRPSTITSAEVDWLKVCPPEKLKELNELLLQAEKLVPADGIYARRIALIRNGLQMKILEGNSKRVLDIIKNTRSADVLKVASAPVLDGKLDDPVWQKGARLTDFTSVGGEKAYVDTQILLAYDDVFLYVGAECFDAPDYEVIAKCKERDGQVYLDDSVEIFIQSDLDSRDYMLIVGNTANTVFDSKNQKAEWNADVKIASSVEPGRWIIEFAIPLNQLGKEGVKAGDTWKMNFCRNRRGLPGFISPYMNWNGPGGYHNINRFGKINFKEQ